MNKVEPLKDDQVQECELVEPAEPETTELADEPEESAETAEVAAASNEATPPSTLHPWGRSASFLTETLLAPQTPPTTDHRGFANVLKKFAIHDVNAPVNPEPKSKYRALIQKAAQRTIMVVRAKHSAQTVQKITIRFSTHEPTELPRTVKLPLLKEKIVCHNHYDERRKNVQLFRHIFESAPELEAIIKDMFWFIVSTEFQTGKHTKLEQDFYDRIADNFTALFVRLQMHPPTRDSGVLEKLPDAMSQLLFLALHDAFPISRYLFDDNMKRKLITICHSWFGGFVPARITWSHWLPELSLQSQRKSAALTDFPALRNRVRRTERLDKIKAIEIQNHQKNLKLQLDEDTKPQSTAPRALPVVSQRIQCLERATYSIRNSPLVATFLERHNLAHNAKILNVDLRLTNDNHHHLDKQQALHQKGAPMQRKRPTLDAASYSALVDKFEAYGRQLKHEFAQEKAKMQEENVASRALFATAQKKLDQQYEHITTRNQGVHELSNMLVSKALSEQDQQRKPPHRRRLAGGAPRRTNHPPSDL
ncbi:unnamed protein product [Aphanomyces euteiches]|uniref:Uncharacterized protein n=1 Tax=Aphanomyces euteiches TaxID=100861 RepID=A0A6G0WST7_9STRA|nr:hypothetical protein Ae201684_011980 [Aphanomyces euteiches]KAH9056142.1 hypothetical protein Ae201684P_021879 [Aphanomyces euteiches]KAH9144417.1 hypothetical protein AeRB84_011642 [Aphanomyces euteiches]